MRRTGVLSSSEAVAAAYLNVHEHPGLQQLGHDHGVALAAGEPQGLGRDPGEVLQGDHAHSHQVAAVDPLVALRQHRLDALGGTGGRRRETQRSDRHTEVSKGTRRVGELSGYVSH